MSLEGFCQNGKCKKVAVVRVHSGIAVTLEEKDGVPTKTGTRTLDLCVEDAEFFLHLRDEVKNPDRIRKFVASCHKD